MPYTPASELPRAYLVRAHRSSKTNDPVEITIIVRGSPIMRAECDGRRETRAIQAAEFLLPDGFEVTHAAEVTLGGDGVGS